MLVLSPLTLMWCYMDRRDKFCDLGTDSSRVCVSVIGLLGLCRGQVFGVSFWRCRHTLFVSC